MRVAAGAALAAASVAAAPAPGAGAPTQATVFSEAAAGMPAASILQTAFPGAALTRRRGATLRVLVADLAPQVIVGGQTPLALTDEGRPRARPRALLPGHRYRIRRVGRGWGVRDLDARRPALRLVGPVRVDAGRAPTGVLMADPLGRRYRGSLRMVKGGGRTIEVVNQVGVEAYLPGVLAGEVPTDWATSAPQAVIAAAILARSRALAEPVRRGPYDLTSDDPTYNGVDGERPATSQAVAQSAGTVVAVGAQPVDAVFPAAPGAAPIAFAPEPGTPDPVAQTPARPIAGAPAGAGPQAVSLALAQLGVPYVWGGSAPGGFDCSGLVYWVYAQLGIPLPRVAEDQAAVGVPVARADLQPGDVVFFADSSGYVHHEGLYLGDGQMVHAPQSGETVRVERIDTGYYATQYAGARRYSPPAP